MKEIKLTRGKIALVDDDDFEYLNQWKWYTEPFFNTFYARKSTRNKRGNIKTRMHSLLMKPKEGFVIDHIDRNGLNNQKSNLRICKSHDNLTNCPKRIDSKNKYKGVRILKHLKTNPYEARIKNLYLGCFPTEADAARAYNKAAIEHFDKFAYLNVIE